MGQVRVGSKALHPVRLGLPPPFTPAPGGTLSAVCWAGAGGAPRGAWHMPLPPPPPTHGVTGLAESESLRNITRERERGKGLNGAQRTLNVTRTMRIRPSPTFNLSLITTRTHECRPLNNRLKGHSLTTDSPVLQQDSSRALTI